MDQKKQQLAADLTRQDPGKVALKGIIKGGTPAMGGFSLQPFRVEGRNSTPIDDSLQREVEQLKEKVQLARANLDRVQIQMETRIAEAHEKGKAQGFAEGEKIGKAQATKTYQDALQNIRRQIDQTIQSMSALQRERWELLQKAGIEIIIAAMQRLHAEELASNPALIGRVVAEALRHLGREEQLVIRVHPLDGPLLEQGRSLLEGEAGFTSELRLECDSRVERGGCRVESDSGVIELSVRDIHARMEEIVRTVYTAQIATSALDKNSEKPDGEPS